MFVYGYDGVIIFMLYGLSVYTEKGSNTETVGADGVLWLILAADYTSINEMNLRTLTIT
jgi:hypothetical protein